jgi:phosphoenolpyruvate carboxykinase (ATP)
MMLGKKMQENKVNVWLINTGWTGGTYGVGKRMKLSYTRAMITAALEGKLDNVTFQEHEVFGVAIPASCPDVPSDLLNPRNTWTDKKAYDEKAKCLAGLFIDNFKKYATGVSAEVLNAAPKIA